MKQLFQNNGTLYVVLRDMPSHQFEDKNKVVDNTKIKVWKHWLEADHVLKFNDRYMFVEVVPTIEYEDLPHIEVNQVEFEQQTHEDINLEEQTDETSN